MKTTTVPNSPVFIKRLKNQLKKNNSFFANTPFKLSTHCCINESDDISYNLEIEVKSLLIKALDNLPYSLRDKHFKNAGLDYIYFGSKIIQLINDYDLEEVAAEVNDIAVKYLKEEAIFIDYFIEFKNTDEAQTAAYQEFVTYIDTKVLPFCGSHKAKNNDVPKHPCDYIQTIDLS